jgi:eukaryotic-like serine/threonine-protein kinase
MSDPVPPNVKTPPVSAPTTPSPGAAGVLHGRFHIEARLGAGGMGEVYRARDSALRRLVAIKRMQHTASEADRKRFLYEGQRASALNHPGIAAIYDVFEEHGEVYLVMEYIEGETLRSRLARPISEAEFLRIATEAANALAVAHDKGILHRDIKPENIMLTGPGSSQPGQVKLLDFGLAQQATDDSGTMETATALTMAGMFMGTPQYMAPEVLNGEPATRRSDIFALGVVLYEMLSSGRHPFAAPTPTAVIGQVLHQPPRPFDPTVSARLAAIVTKTLAKSPADRYPDAHHIVRDLQDPLATPSVVSSAAAPAANRPSSPSRLSTGRRTELLIAGAVMACGLIIAAIIYLPHRRQAQPSGSAATPAATITPGTLAVLPPIVIDKADTQLASFGRGLSESLAQHLSDLSINHDITVLSAGQLQDKKAATLAAAARELGATTGLSIALSRQGELVRAAWKLSAANPSKESASKEKVLASGTVTAPASDMFAVENQLAIAAASALNIPLRTDEQRALAAHGTTFPDAYQYFLQGRGYLLQAFTPETFRSAQTMFKEALRIDPNYGAAKAALGESWITDYENNAHLSSIDEARRLCDQAVALGNAGAEGHNCLGRLAQDTSRSTDAVNEFQKALQLEPASEVAAAGLAKAYQKLNQPEKAEAVYKQQIALHPNDFHQYDLLGAFYFSTADFANAERMFRMATEKNPLSFRSYANLGAALMSQEKDAEAIEALKRSVAIRPTDGGYGNLAIALFRLRRFDEAADQFRKAIQMAPDVYDKWASLGDAEYYGGRQVQAMTYYKKAVELATAQLTASPNDATILGDLGGLHSMLGDKTQAVEYMNRALAINHNDPNLMFNAALLYNQLDQTGPALEWLSKALAAGESPSVVAKAPALDNLRANPRYQQLMQSAQRQP